MNRWFVILLIAAAASGCREPADPGPGQQRPGESPSVFVGSPSIALQQRGEERAGQFKMVPSLANLSKPKSGSELPKPITPKHGGFSWIVILAATDGPSSPEDEDERAQGRLLEQAAAKLTANFNNPDYTYSGGSDTSCDQGAAMALRAVGLASPHAHIAEYFDNERDARHLADTLDPSPLAVVYVQTYCLD